MEDNRPIIASGPDPEPQPTLQPQSVPQPQPNPQSQPATQSQPQPILQSQSIPPAPIDPRSLVKPAKLPDFMLESSSPNPAKNEDGDIILSHSTPKKNKKNIILATAAILLTLASAGLFYLFSNLNRPSISNIQPKILKYASFIKTGELNNTESDLYLISATAYQKIASEKDQSKRQIFAQNAKRLYDDFAPDFKKYLASHKPKTDAPKAESSQHQYLERLTANLEKNFLIMQEFLSVENIEPSKLTKEEISAAGGLENYIRVHYDKISKLQTPTTRRFISAKTLKNPDANNIIVQEHNINLHFFLKAVFDTYKKEIK